MQNTVQPTYDRKHTFRDFCHEEAVLEKSYATARNLVELTSTSAQQGVKEKNCIQINNENDENIKIRT